MFTRALRVFLFLTILFPCFYKVSAQSGAIINEVSNGTAGVQEYFEILVVGGSGSCTVDLRGFILDDNNGDFSCGPRSGAGIAQGHLRFSSSGPWSSVPVGSLIVVYNGDDRNVLIPPDDPFDLNNDSIYIISSLHPDIEVSDGTAGCSGTDIPVGCTSSCPGTGNAGYGVTGYTLGGSWNTIGLRNSGGDAAQVRAPGGAYFHGISYGNSNMTGGPDGINFPVSTGGGRNYYFNDGSFRSAVNYSEGVAGVDETPGAANNALNRAFINSLKCPPSVLPVELSEPLNGTYEGEAVKLWWATSSEVSHRQFVIARTGNLKAPFEKIGAIPGFHPQGYAYSFIDLSPLHGNSWYRLIEEDLDGKTKVVGQTMVSASGLELRTPTFDLFPNPAFQNVTLQFDQIPDLIELVDLTGKTLLQVVPTSFSHRLNIEGFLPGLYLVRVKTQGYVSVQKLILGH